MKRILLTAIPLLFLAMLARAVPVKVTMNRTSPTMTLANKATGESIEVGEKNGMTYTFEVPAATYVLTALATDGATVSGIIELTVSEDGSEQEFTVVTCTAYLYNGWKVDEDYTLSVDVVSREGTPVVQTLGKSTTEGRSTFLAFNGNSYYATFTPSEEHQAEGYMPLYLQGTLTGNINVAGQIRRGMDYTITLPADAELFVGMKTAHYIPYIPVEPVNTEVEGTQKRVTYHLTDRQVYNYRTWREGGLTQAGYFTMYMEEDKMPQLTFTDSDYDAFGAQTIKHDVKWNGGYETGDILLNINERGHLTMQAGESRELRALRSWQLTDTQTNNYFMEPDFHYTIIGLDGQPLDGVVAIDASDNVAADPWVTLRAIGQGTAIVLVTYDAIGLNYYERESPEKKTYMGGEYWGAIWPENTAAFVVTVGGSSASGIDPNMTINETYNDGLKKLSGKYVDAEHDVFYYLDTEEGYRYTFTPQGVAKVEMARPVIGEHMATYVGFSTDGVTKNEDGSYTLLLKEGRTIVRLSDAAGQSVYQVLTAKKCHREIVNASRPGSQIFQPGDKVKVQYSGLRHPANKLAGIYNMSAYVTYNGTPNGTSLILSPNQYTFGSAASAQAVTIDIPVDYDVESQPELVMGEGVIQVNGYGDPIGNHRNTTRTGGRSANFTAVAHKTYFGAIPDVRLQLSPVKYFIVRPIVNVEGASVSISPAVTDNGDGTYTATYGTYTITVGKAGYRCFRSQFTIADDAEGEQTVAVDMVKAENPNTWDGQTVTEPGVDAAGVYKIATAAELAWLQKHVNEEKQYGSSAVLTADIDLGDYEWTPIGGQKFKEAYSGSFDGQGHTISGLHIDNGDANYQALFSYIANSTISRLTVEGTVRGRQYVAGIVGLQDEESTTDRCVNHVKVIATYGVAGGVVSHHNAWSATTSNCINLTTITAPSLAGGVVGSNFITSHVYHCLGIGEVVANSAHGACVGGNGSKDNVSDNYGTHEYAITGGQTLVTEEQLRSGEVAWLLGEAFGQNLGTEPDAAVADTIPVIDGMKVFKVIYTTNSTAQADSLYTNGTLPTHDATGNWELTWRTAPDGEVITKVTTDSTLYAELKDVSGVKEISNDPRAIVGNQPTYDLTGHRVSSNAKHGIYIRNGKKIMVK